MTREDGDSTAARGPEDRQIRRRLGRFPVLLGQAFRLVWTATPRGLVVITALQLLGGIGTAFQLLIGQQVLTKVIDSSSDDAFRDVVPSLVALALVTAVISFVNVARTEHQRLLTEQVTRYCLDRILDVTTHIDVLEYERPSFHDRLQRAQVNAASRPLQIVTGVLGIVSSTFAIIGVAIALLVIEPVLLVVVLVGFVPGWLVTRRASRITYDFYVRQTQRDRKRFYLFLVLTRKEESAEVRSFNSAPFLRSRYEAAYDERIDDLATTVKRRMRLGLLSALITSGVTASVLALLVWLVTTDRMPLAAAGAGAAAIALLGQRLATLAGSAGTLYEGALFLDDFTGFIESCSATIEAARRTQGAVAPAAFQRLTVDGVDFTYPSRAEPSLHDVSLDIEAGMVVALVGENGSGKTTLAKLLAGLYAPERGAIRWDDTDLADVDAGVLRESITVIFQDFVRYVLSASDNVALGRHERADDHAAIVDAAERAGIHRDLTRLPDGYATTLGPQFAGGSDLSGGQWQRVALARALFRDAPLVILDEPTASLDPRVEAELFESVRSLCRGRTVVIISHRFSTVRSADRIYVLDRGGVIEHGTHDELMAGGGKYHELFTLQAASYLDVTS